MRKKLTQKRSPVVTVWWMGLALVVLVAGLIFVPPIVCNWISQMHADWEISLGGVTSSNGSVGFTISGRLFSVDVETGETVAEIGPRLTALMKEEGLAVECEVYDGEHYYFIVRGVGQPVAKPEGADITLGSGGPLQDDRMSVEHSVRAFYSNLNDNYRFGVTLYTTDEFREEALDTMASMAESGEELIIESVDDLTIDCYQATVCLHLTRVVGTERQPIDTCLTLTRPSLGDIWLVSGGAIR